MYLASIHDIYADVRERMKARLGRPPASGEQRSARLTIDFDYAAPALTLLYRAPSGAERTRQVTGSSASIDIETYDGVAGGQIGLVRFGLLVDAFTIEEAAEEEADRYRFTYEDDLSIAATDPGVNPFASATITPRIEYFDGGARLYWDDLGEDVSYRLYVSRDGVFEDLSAAPHLHTERPRAVVTGLTEEAHVMVGAEHPAGYALIPTSSHALVPEANAEELPVAVQSAPLETAQLEADESLAYDLRDYVRIIPGDGENAAQDLFSALTGTITTTGPFTATLAAGILTVTADAGAALDETGLILIRLWRSGFQSLYVGLLAEAKAGSSKTGYGLSGLHHDALGSAVELSVGENVTPTTPAAFDRPDYALTGSTLTIQRRAAHGDPEVLLLPGATGAQCLVISHDYLGGRADIRLPQLPAGVSRDELYVEGRDLWESVSWESLLPDRTALRRADWRRLLVGTEGETDAQLYDLGPHAAPALLHYEPPVFFQNRWFDRERFPSDVGDRLAYGDDGRVAVYRRGLTSPPAISEAPEIEDLEAKVDGTGVRLSWTAKRNGEKVAALQMPVYLRTEGETGRIARYGYDRLSVDGLLPHTTYDAWLLHESASYAKQQGLAVSFTTARPAPGVTIEGFLEEEGTYRYRFTVLNSDEDAWQDWTDPFGGLHTDTVIDLIREEPIERFRIAIRFSDETVTTEVDTLWRRPQGSSEFIREVQTGYVVAADRFETPVFRAVRYAGTREKTLKHNMYSAGSYRVRPLGFLPAELDGHLEDHVEAVFVGPDGEELGETVDLDAPAELAVRLRITAQAGHTPFVKRVRIDKTRSNL